MDLPAALERVAEQVILSGNLDPAEVFLNGTPESIRAHRRALLDATVAYPNFFVSSGCDLPPGVPVENLTAFYEA
jgi:uroporphyrinogen decarboxylase